MGSISTQISIAAELRFANAAGRMHDLMQASACAACLQIPVDDECLVVLQENGVHQFGQGPVPLLTQKSVRSAASRARLPGMAPCLHWHVCAADGEVCREVLRTSKGCPGGAPLAPSGAGSFQNNDRACTAVQCWMQKLRCVMACTL